MDPELGRIFGGEGRKASINVTLLVHGAVMNGNPSSPSRWGEDVNQLVKEQPALPDVDPLDVAWLIELSSDADADQHGCGTLRDVTMVLPSGESFRLPFVRVDLEQVGAWWLRPPERA